ncbi:MAG: PIN domain-containing protein [Terriglobales bacterium]|jgi:predicted nucleic acid-binding protein
MLADTNILLRLARKEFPEYAGIRGALQQLRREGTTLYYAPQNLVELWRVYTRPVEQNGFGLSIEAADQEASLIEAQIQLIPDTAEVHRHWRRLVVEYRVAGRQVHDARLVAVMIANGISRLLTLNVADFQRYANVIRAVHPHELAGS